MNPETPRDRLLQNRLIPALVTLVPLGMMLAWWRRNQVLPYWDDAGYMEMTVRLYDAVAARGLRGLVDGFFNISAVREPLIAVQALPTMALLGRSIEAAKLVNGVFVILLCVYLYRLCRLYWPWPVGAAAALLTAGSPLMTDMMNAWLREYPLTALLVMTAYCLATSDGLRRRREGVILGALLGVAMLYRALYPLYAAGLYAWVLAPRLRQGRGEWRRLAADLALVAGVGALIAGPWYAVNWRETLGHMLTATRGVVALDYGSADVFAWPVIRDYLRGMARYGTSVWTLIVAGAGLAGSAAALARGRLRWSELAPDRAWWMLAGWGAPFIVFLFGVNKEYRFVTPLLPAAAIAAAALLWGASRAFRGAWLLAAPAAALGALLLIWGEYDLGGGPALRRAHAALTGNIVIRRPEINRWPYARMIRYLDEQAPRRKRRAAGVMMLSDTVHFNPDLLQLWATLGRRRLTVTSSIRLRHSEAAVREAFGRAAVLVAKEGGERDLPMKNPGPELLAEALKAGSLVELAPPAIELPDGGRLRVWRRK